MKAPVEVQFAQKLAANEKVIRDRAVRKLKKWLGARSDQFEDDEMMRIWKGLYYCYWMSDKMMVQEELAENISSMVSCFSSSQNTLVFVKSFVRTFGREWFGIDRWRMDKFMMFVRRFLRHTFRFLAGKGWEKGLVTETANIFRTHVILCPASDTALGFQLHLTDVFLEELAKVGGETLDTEVLETFLEPFTELVISSGEDRLRKHVVERIFKHLVRQSDPGIEWEMEEDGFEEVEDDEEEPEDDEEDGGDIVVNGEDESHVNGNGHLDEKDEDVVEDPRAGKVDVVIPQISVNYSKLSEEFFAAGSREGVRKTNRDELYTLSKMFKDVSGGVFPLGPDISELEAVDIPIINVKKSATELMKRNDEMLAKNLKGKEQLKKRKREASVAEEEKEEEQTNKDAENNSDNEEGDSNSEGEPMENVANEGKGMTGKEFQRKRKAEMKRKKREKQLKLKEEKDVRDEKIQQLLQNDLERKSEENTKIKINTTGECMNNSMTNNIDVAVEVIDEQTSSLINGEPEVPSKKKKKKKSHDKITETVGELKLDIPEENEKTNPKKKSKKRPMEPSAINPTIAVEVEVPKKKKKKKKNTEEKVDVEVAESDENKQACKTALKPEDNSNVNYSTVSEVCGNTTTINPTVAVEVEEVQKKKKKKKNTEDKVDVGVDKSDENKKACTTEIKHDDNSNVNDSAVSEECDNTAVKGSKKKKKKKCLDSANEMNITETSTDNVTDNISVAEEASSVYTNGDVAQTPTSTKESKKKKKKKEMYRVDSDICFGSLSVSATNLAKIESDSKTDEKEETKLPSIPETEQSTPLAASNLEESPVLKRKSADTETPSSKKKSKKKMSRSNAATSLSVASTETKAPPDPPASLKEGPKMFEESNDWDCPLLPGETEIVLPNKMYKGSSKLKAAAESVESLPGFDSPRVEPVKSFTATFLKKALSKSSAPSTPVQKKQKKADIGEKRSKSEPRKKKINFALTNNSAQEMSEHLSSVKNSPQIPHDPEKNPTKTLLKKRVSLESGKRLNPVQLNTQLNSRSLSAKKLAGKKRANAMDFF